MNPAGTTSHGRISERLLEERNPRDAGGFGGQAIGRVLGGDAAQGEDRRGRAALCQFHDEEGITRAKAEPNCLGPYFASRAQ